MDKLTWFFRDPEVSLDFPLEEVVVISVCKATLKGAVSAVAFHTRMDRFTVNKCLIATPINGRMTEYEK